MISNGEPAALDCSKVSEVKDEEEAELGKKACPSREVASTPGWTFSKISVALKILCNYFRLSGLKEKAETLPSFSMSTNESTSLIERTLSL